jgi:hypothetical protein
VAIQQIGVKQDREMNTLCEVLGDISEYILIACYICYTPTADGELLLMLLVILT